MEGEKILMSQRQLQKLRVIGLVEAGKMTLKEAAEKIGMSYRQAKRIRKRVQENGVKGLIHGNTGKLSNHRMKKGIKAKVLKLSQKVYGEFNDQRFTEKLAEEEGIEVSRETVRKIRRAAGMGPKRKRRGKKHRKRRERKAPGWLNGSLGWQPPPLVRARSSSLLFNDGHP